MGKRLFLIGNGFDIRHTLHTKYLDLLEWLEKNDSKFLDKLNDLLLRNFFQENGYFDELKGEYKITNNEIAERVKKLDIEKVKKSNAYRILSKYSYICYDETDGILAAYVIWESLEEYLYYVFLNKEINEATIEEESIVQILTDEEYGQVTKQDFAGISRPLRKHLDNMKKLADDLTCNLLGWVYEVNEDISNLKFDIDNGNLYNPEIPELLSDNFFKDEDYIINFNYSDTIEKIYSKHVFHIHGSDDASNPPIMGHTKKFSEMNVCDERELDLVKKLYKNFDSILESNDNYFKQINNVDEIVVLGLGYTKTDEPYFIKINTLLPSAKWKLYYYSDEDLKKAKRYVDDIGIQSYEYISLKENSPFTKADEYDLDD